MARSGGTWAKGTNPTRKKGSISAKTRAWEELGEYICNSGAQRAMEILSKQNDMKYIASFMAILEYFKPKLARTELTGNKDNPVQINVTSDKDITRLGANG